MKINCMVEGGLGDLILASRFIAATREAYPDAHIQVFINNEGNKPFTDFFKKHWGYLFDSIYEGDMSRVSKNYVIHSQFGTEQYNSAIQNLQPDTQAAFYDADKSFNFHLDSLSFIDYSDIPWQKYLKYVPRPANVEFIDGLPKKFVAVNLYAREGHFSAISKENAESIIRNLRAEHDVVIIAPSEEVRDTYYEKNKDIVKVTNLEESLSIVSKSQLGVSLDSGLRCMFYPFGKTCFTLCAYIKQAFQVPPSHILRWYIYPEHMLPVDVKGLYLSSLVGNAIEKPGCQIFPNVSSSDIDKILIHRKYA